MERDMNEYLDNLSKNLENINKKLDRIYKMLTNVSKTLHLVPVTATEEKQIQITQRNNLKAAADILEVLDDMQNKTEPKAETYTQLDLFGDVLGDDYLSKLSARKE